MRHVLAFPKPSRLEDPDYLRFISRQPCLIDHVSAEAHQAPPRSLGGSDFRTLPLCRYHYSILHTLGSKRFEVKFGINLAGEQVNFLETYLAAYKAGENLGAKKR